MVCKAEACAKCTQKCLLLHGKGSNSSPDIISFFKFIIGNHYSKVLFLPPKFAPASALVDQKTLLEDANGQQWEVTISNVDGSLAFEQGWNTFVLDHKLEIGDIMVFYYIKESHFVVKIYDRTSLEKLDFPENRNQRKRATTGRNSVVKDGPHYTNNEGSTPSVISGTDVQISQSQCEMNDLENVITKITSNCDNSDRMPRPVPKAQCLEDPYFIIDRDLGDKQEDRCTIFDLSNFEILKSDYGTDRNNKIGVADDRFPRHDDASSRSQKEAVLDNKDPVDEKIVNRVVPCKASGAEMMEILKNNSGTNGSNRFRVGDDRYPDQADVSPRPQIEAVLVRKDPVDEKIVNRVASCKASGAEMMEILKNNSGTNGSNGFRVGDDRYPDQADVSPRPQIEAVLVRKDPVDEKIVNTVASCKASGAEMMEILKNNSGTNKRKRVGDDGYLDQVDVSSRPQIEAVLVNKYPVGELVANIVVTPEDSDTEMMENLQKDIVTVPGKISINRKIPEHLLFTTAVEPEKNGGKSCDISNGVVKKCHIAEEEGKDQLKWHLDVDKVIPSQKEHTSLTGSNQSAQLKFTGKPKKSNVPATTVKLNCQSGGGNMKIVKQEHVEMLPELCSAKEMIQGTYGKVKPESLDFVPFSSPPTTAKLSCEISSNNQHFLELSTSLPTFYKSKSKTVSRVKVVLLRDREMRTWPVLYHERSEFTILTSGWEAFSQANNIQPGDKCVFEVESELESIFSVKIVRN